MPNPKDPNNAQTGDEHSERGSQKQEPEHLGESGSTATGEKARILGTHSRGGN